VAHHYTSTSQKCHSCSHSHSFCKHPSSQTFQPYLISAPSSQSVLGTRISSLDLVSPFNSCSPASVPSLQQRRSSQSGQWSLEMKVETEGRPSLRVSDEEVQRVCRLSLLNSSFLFSFCPHCQDLASAASAQTLDRC
jgi:hypothetical protein